MIALALFLLQQPLEFEIAEGGNRNWFWQSPDGAFHLRVTNPENPRVIVALPAGNAGVALSFDPSFAENRGLSWTGEAPTLWRKGAVRGADVWLTADRSRVRLSQALLDSMRLLRTSAYRDYASRVNDRIELGMILGLPTEGWAQNRVARGDGALDFHRHTLGGENNFAASLRFDGATTVTLNADGTYTLERADGKPLRMRLQAGADYAPLTPIPLDELLTPEARRLYESGDARTREAVNALRFLSYREKFLAGSHRFNTYFGRDTMLTTLLAGPMLTPVAREAALKSVLDRLSPDGVVAHEEDIGAQAERRRVEEALAQLRGGSVARMREILKNPQSPIYDYKMVDGDFILPLLAREVPELGPHREALVRNLDRIIADASPYAKSGDVRDLIAFKEGTVGDWRDSNAGNGLGKYSATVNAHLVPLGLVAAADVARRLGLPERAAKLDELATAWKGAKKRFEVTRGGTTFEAVALDAAGKPIPVMHSDIALDLLFGEPTPAEVREILRVLRTPYPRGLKTPVGTLVANPSLSDRPGDMKMFDKTAYHGTVVWGWQETMIELGLARQAKRPELRAEILPMLEEAVAARRRAGTLANAELWTFDGKGAAPYVGASTEANPVQLWSALAPAERMAIETVKREATGAGHFAAAYLLKEAMNGRIAVRDLAEPRFWGDLGVFTLAARATRRLPAAFPLAAGMAAVQLVNGHFSPRDLAIDTASFLAAGAAVSLIADGLIYPVLFAAGPPGWIAAGAYTVAKLAVTLYAGEKLGAWLRGMFATRDEGRETRDGVVQKLQQIGE